MRFLLYAAAAYALAPQQHSAALDAVERAIDEAVASTSQPIEALPPAERESVAIARRLRRRLDSFARNGDCRRCWLQRAHCVCESCRPLDDLGPAVRRIYVYMHHKEVLLAVDTAKLILAAYAEARLVIAGLKGQPAEAEMRAALEDGAAVVLFPSDDAAPASALAGPVDVVVIDGTWEQAQKLNARLPGRRAKLDDDIVDELSRGEGRQLRSHPTAWREVGTLAATRHFLGALGVSSAPVLADYQAVADAAARRQLGPPRLSPKRR